MRKMYAASFLIIAVIGSACESARILAVFPTPSVSHQVVFRRLTQELAKRGHEVVVITTDPAFPKGETPKNLTEIDVHDISYKLWREEVLTSATTSGKNDDIITQLKIMLPLLSKIFEIQMQTEEVQQLISNRNSSFDFLLIEACVRPAISVSHVFKVPVILVSSFSGVIRNFDVMGVPMRPPLHYPTSLRQRIYNLSIREKFTELYHHYLIENLFSSAEYLDNQIITKLFGPNTPPLTELENNVHMMFLNVNLSRYRGTE